MRVLVIVTRLGILAALGAWIVLVPSLHIPYGQ